MKRLFTKSTFFIALALFTCVGFCYSQTVSTVTTTNSTGPYKIGDVITVRVTFSAAVDVTTGPRIELNVTPTTRYANATPVTNATQVNFTYTVQSSDVSTRLDYASTGALTLNSGTIFATSTSTPANLALPATASSGLYTTNLVIDGVAPGAFTTGAVTTNTGGNVVAGYYNISNTSGITVAVPIDNDASLNTGTIQIQVSNDGPTGAYVNLGSPVSIPSINITQNVNITNAVLIANSKYGDGNTLNFRAIITDIAGNSRTGTESGSTL
ncbi:MAG: hypothetical protein IM620_16160, partial [Cytophagales bacterium]|nr:hypothetical protein [Cytophagales bacterium]